MFCFHKHIVFGFSLIMLRSFAAELDGLISVAVIRRQAHRSLFTEPGNHWEVWDPACHYRNCNLPQPFAETAPGTAAAEGAMELAGGWGCRDPTASRHQPSAIHCLSVLLHPLSWLSLPTLTS